MFTGGKSRRQRGAACLHSTAQLSWRLLVPLLAGIVIDRSLLAPQRAGGSLGGGPTSSSSFYVSSVFRGGDDDAAAAAAKAHEAWRRAKDEEPIHVFHSICGKGVTPHDMAFHGFTVIKSILAAREVGPSKRRRYHFHVAVDDAMERLMRDPQRVDMADTLEYLVNRTDGRVNISWYHVNQIQADAVAVVGADAAAAVDISLFKECSTIRLKLPFIRGPLLLTDRVIYIDFDAIVTCDLETMWEEEFAAFDPQQIIAVSEEGAHEHYWTAYLKDPADPVKRVKLPSKYVTGLNAGILAARLDRWRAVAVEYWTRVAEIVAGGGYEAMGIKVDGKTGLTYGDQDILNLLSVSHPQYFKDLPLRYNWRFQSHEPASGHLTRLLPPGREYRPQVSCIQHYI